MTFTIGLAALGGCIAGFALGFLICAIFAAGAREDDDRQRIALARALRDTLAFIDAFAPRRLITEPITDAREVLDLYGPQP